MKKTTIRIAGFLLAAACVALLASCNQANKPTTNNNTTTPGGTNGGGNGGGGGTTPAALKQADLKNSLWKIKDSKLGEKAYLFHFDNVDAVDLRVAYGDKLEKDKIKTRKATVAYTIKDGKITIAELNIKDAAIKMDQNKKELTVTVSSTQTITLEKVTAPEGVDFKKTADSNDDVVGLFNALFGVNKFGGMSEKGKVWQVTKIEGTDVSAKKLYIIFSSDDKVTLAVDSGSDLKTKADAEVAYSSSIAKHLGSPSLTITGWITDAKLAVMGATPKRTAVLTVAADKVWELAESNVVGSYFTASKAMTEVRALFVK